MHFHMLRISVGPARSSELGFKVTRRVCCQGGNMGAIRIENYDSEEKLADDP